MANQTAYMVTRNGFPTAFYVDPAQAASHVLKKADYVVAGGRKLARNDAIKTVQSQTVLVGITTDAEIWTAEPIVIKE